MSLPSDIARSRLLPASVALLASLLTACGGGSDDNPTASEPTRRTVTGQVAKGPLDNATVTIFALDAGGRALGTPLAEAITDATGAWAVTLPAGSGALLAQTSGGRYVDEADPEPDPALRRSVTLAAGEGFAALIPPDATSVAINLYTDALLRKSRNETAGAEFSEVYARNRASLARAFGFDPVATLPADPIAPARDASDDARRYAMALGGVANVVNDYAIANGRTIGDFEIIAAVLHDLTDCVINGVGIDGALEGIATVTLDLNEQILRFRNNNFAAFEGDEVMRIDTAECASSGRIDDTVAPVFTLVPADFTVAAVDARGIPASAVAITTVLAEARASDDRDGVIAPVALLPPQLPLGTTTITLRAVDAAGNASEATVVVTVADLDPPTIIAPADIDIAATGALTMVDTGLPIVADNVTSATSLIVTNDAPAAGFAPGATLVTWSVSDEAGLGASATQQVTVRTAPPTLVGELPDRTATEGEAFSALLGAAFVDPDSVLSFELTGLPAGTGLSFDAATATLAGVPTDADAKATPLALTVTARDETDEASATFQLLVADVNNAPVFAVSGDVSLQEDFSDTVFVEVMPAPVPAGDENDVVYSLTSSSADFVALSIDPDSGRVAIDSRPDANGSGSITITADDGADVNNLYSVTVSVDVAAVDDAPRFSLSAGTVDLSPGFSGTVLVDALPAPVPADEADQVVRYRVEHGILFATIAIDAATGQVSIGNTARLEASGLIDVIADDGVSSHSETLTLIVREDRTITTFVGEPVAGVRATVPRFARDEVPVAFAASGLPASLAIGTTTGELSGTPTEVDGEVGAMPVEFRVTGSRGTTAVIPQVLHVVERDSDADGLPDRIEFLRGTDAALGDSDGDGLGDGLEVEAGTDPLVPATTVSWFEPGAPATLALPGGFSADDPAVYVFAAGVHDVAITLTPPCNHVVLVGGVTASALYPTPATRTVLTPADEAPIVAIDGCTDVRLHHLSLAEGEGGAALTARGATLSGADLALYRHEDGAVEITDTDLRLADSVWSGNDTERALIEVHGASDVVLEQAVIRHDAFMDVLHVAADSVVELVALRGPAGFRGAGRVIKTGGAEFVVHAPDELRLRAGESGDYVASLYYLGLRLGRGYVITHAGDDIESIHDINGGDYLVRADGEPGTGIMFFVNGMEVPFVIE